MAAAGLIAICESAALSDGGEGLRFEVQVAGERCGAFAIRYQGRIHAYLNRCAHVAMELDWLPGAFFDDEGRYLMCSTHGALYEPDTGRCAGGACLGFGGLRKIEVVEDAGTVYWQPEPDVRPV